MKSIKSKNRSKRSRTRYITVSMVLILAIVAIIIVVFNSGIITNTVGSMMITEQKDNKKENTVLAKDETSNNKVNNNEDTVIDEDKQNSDEDILINEDINNKSINNESINNVGYDAKLIEERIRTCNYNNNGEKMVFLTFDDGTSTTVTPKILDILDEENVKATFFVVGSVIQSGGEAAKNLVVREYKSGHAIGNHSYSHNYSLLYPNRYLNIENFKEDYEKNNQLLKSILGENFSTRVLRCPGGYMSWNGMSQLQGYTLEGNKACIDWNAVSGDAEAIKRDANGLVNYTIETSKGRDVVILLMHDTYGKEETVKALVDIIRYFKNNGYEFKTLI